MVNYPLFNIEKVKFKNRPYLLKRVLYENEGAIKNKDNIPPKLASSHKGQDKKPIAE